ncbi:hypothetical protein [Pseudohongiella acticola]|nr:hypothetical protein [Pseudohongiella acticola]
MTFRKSWGRHAAGDRAGFNADLAKQLEERKIAVPSASLKKGGAGPADPDKGGAGKGAAGSAGAGKKDDGKVAADAGAKGTEGADKV